MHAHQCKNCGLVYQHDEMPCADEKLRVKAHTCPRCRWYDDFWSDIIYYGREVPRMTNHHLLEPGQRDLAGEIVDEEPPFA